jgi:hypothetical protein
MGDSPPSLDLPAVLQRIIALHFPLPPYIPFASRANLNSRPTLSQRYDQMDPSKNRW